MISITCTNCQAGLTIDDAFAGGVCRCQYCGTIQTVPAKGKATTSSAKPQPVPAPKTLYQNKTRTRAGGSDGAGLDDLANAVISSGLSGSGLSSRRHTMKRGAADRRNLMPILLIVCGTLVVVVGILLAVVLFRGRGSTSSSTSGPNNGIPTPADGSGETGTGATFCGIPLHSGSTIFLLDRGNSISDEFDAVKSAAFKAVEQLGPTRRFEVIMWNNGSSGPSEFPAGQMLDATSTATAELRKTFQDSIASGRSRLSSALKTAASRNPHEIVIVTAKGADDLDEDDVAVLQSMVGKNIRIDAVQVYPVSPSPNKVLQEVSRASGGQFRNVSAAGLRESAR